MHAATSTPTVSTAPHSTFHALPARDIRVDLPADFRLRSGDTLPQRSVTARLVGAPGTPLLIVAGGISADRHAWQTPEGAPGWWAHTVAPGGAIDLNRRQVLCVDYAPGAEGPGRPVTIATEDQARLVAFVLDALGIARVAGFVGSSYGGMVALAFAALLPQRLERLVVISAAHRAHPQATAWRGIQRRILQLGMEAGRPEDGVALARELAMTTYRTAEELGERFASTAPQAAGQPYPVCTYLTARGRAYRQHTTPARWLSLSDSIDRHAVAPESVAVPTVLVGFTSDRLVPIEDIRALAHRLPQLQRLVEAPSLYGHDAFLKENALVGSVLREALAL